MLACKVHIDRNRALSYLVVAAAAFFVFLPWVQAYFLGDDWMEIARNSGRALPPQLRSISEDANSRGYRPLSESFLAWPWPLFGLNPAGYHVIGFALHALNAVLVAWLGQRLARDRRVGLLAGLSFAVLGCHTEAVLWLSARNDPEAATFALVSVVSYVRFRDGGRRVWWIGAAVLYILSLLFKETTLALPLLLTLYDLIFVFPPQESSPPWRQSVGQLIPVLPLAMAGVTYLLFRLTVGGGYDVPVNVPSLPKNLVYYLLMETVALPDSTRFVSRFPLATLPVIASLTFACVLSIWLARGRLMRHRVVLYGALWMVIALAPVILIVAERTTYFSSVGWAWAIAAIVILGWDAGARGRFTPQSLPENSSNAQRGSPNPRPIGGFDNPSGAFKTTPHQWLVVLALAVILGANLVTLVHRSYWWNRAADISRDVISQVQAVLLNLPSGEGSQLWFLNFPDRIEYAYAFGDRIPFAVWLLQNQLGVDDVEALVFRGGTGDVPSPERVRQMLSERAIAGMVVAFYWQGETVTQMSTLEGVLQP